MSIDEAAHVTLSGDRTGEYVIVEEREDGALVLAPDLSVTAILRRQGMTPATLGEFEAEYGSLGPPDLRGIASRCRQKGPRLPPDVMPNFSTRGPRQEKFVISAVSS